jgi:CubicO group peptidase (beta-lactamase class C family)
MTRNGVFKGLQEIVEKSLFYYDLPGLSVRVDLGDDVFSAAVGYQDFAEKRPLTTDHIFHMGSVTKLLVGTSILLLAEDGRLGLEDKVSGILPWFSMADPAYARITLSQLLSHTSGMPDVTDYHWEMPETDDDALVRYVRSQEVTGARLLWAPEEGRFAYSNMAYEVLGTVIAEVSGLTFEDFVQTRIFDPLSMNDSSLLTFQRNADTLCIPHLKDSENRIVAAPHFPYNRAHGPSSTLTSHPADLSKFAKANLSRSLLRQETYDLAWSRIALVPNNGEHVGLSWFRREQKSSLLYGHEGTDDGFRASFWICPEQMLHITVCTNLSGAPTKKICKQIFDHIVN